MDLEQIFEYAIDQETKAQEFYEISAAQTENAEAAALFRSLARMEIGHRRALENERRILTETGELKIARMKVPSEQEQMLASLRYAAEVLKETNVELKLQQKKTEAELEMAARIQRNLLPTKVPQLADLEISVACHMAKYVGGDYYDYLFNPLGHLNVTIGDVSGKGIPAALLMVVARTLWRSKVRDGNPPDRVLELLTQDISPEFSESDQFITILSGSYAPQQHVFTFANAGHWPPLHYSAAAQAFSPLPPGFLPIGLEAEAEYILHEVELNPGDVMVLFSDGIIESKNPSRELFGEERLMGLIAQNHGASADKIRKIIIDEVDEFSSGRRDDDQTLMVFKRVKGKG